MSEYKEYVKISDRGQLVLPKKIRQLANIGAGSTLSVTWSDDQKQVVIEPMKSFADRLAGLGKGLRPKGESVVESIRNLRAERNKP